MKKLVRLPLLMLCVLLTLSSAMAAPPDFVVRHGDRSVNKIAITVDDCFDVEVIRKMHDLSQELGFPITWFPVAYRMEDSHKALWEEILAAGNEMGNHSWKHSSIPSHSQSNARVQLLKPQAHIDQLLGYHYPLRLFRPPYGAYKNDKVNYLNYFYENGVEKVVLWDVDTTDPQEAFKNTQNGSILLFHTNNRDYNCLVELVPMLQEAGFELVTISELLNLEPLQTSDELYIYTR